jgi:hypothetical protein
MNHLRGLVSRSRTQIERGHPGLNLKMRDNRLRSDILLSRRLWIDVQTRFLERGFGD